MQKEEIIYKTTGGIDLRLHVFEREGRREGPPSAAIVYFFGGGWFGGTPEQFYPQCEYFASRGMLAASAEYRVKGKHGVSPLECAADGKSAIRWLRSRAAELNIVPDRIAAGGGSAGGHVAACAAMVEQLDEPGEDLSVSSRPDALVLFNPGVDLFNIGVEVPAMAGLSESEKRLLSPDHHIRPGLPPSIVFQGTGDATVPYESVERFAHRMSAAGNSCKLVAFKGMGHGFANYGRHENKPYIEATRATDEFLCSLGFAEGHPAI
jgi:acetyl esterase